MASRKSIRVSKRKWPCGACGIQCIDNAVFCEKCATWYHAKCEGLSASNLSIMHRLTEDYLCSCCTHVRGIYDFPAALKRLENASRREMLESGVKMEHILMRNTPHVKAKAEEQQFGIGIDAVAHDILRQVGK